MWHLLLQCPVAAWCSWSRFYLDGGWKPIASSFSEGIQKSGGIEGRWSHERVMDLLNKAIPPTLTFLRKECHEYIKTVDAQLVWSLLRFLESSLKTLLVDDDECEDPSKPNKALRAAGSLDERKLLDMLFAMAFIYTVGGNVDDATRERFSEHARKLFETNLHISFPSDGLV